MLAEQQDFLGRSRARLKRKFLTGWATIAMSVAVPWVLVVNAKPVEEQLTHRIELASVGLDSVVPTSPLEVDLAKRLALALEGAQTLTQTAALLFRIALVFLASAGLGAGVSFLTSAYRDQQYLRIIDHLEGGGAQSVR